MKGINDYGSVVLTVQEVTIDSNCGGNWNAAKRSPDETGLEVAMCHHHFRQIAMNMLQGELFGYLLLWIKKFIVPKKIKNGFAKVMCKLWKFIGQHESNIKKSLKPTQSVMHANGYSFD